jgi:hypothetical protein
MRVAALVLISIFLAPCLAVADTRDDVTAGIYRCGRIADDRQWLECLYGAAQPMRSKLGLPPAPESQQTLSRQQSDAPAPPSMAMARPAAAAPLVASAVPATAGGFGLPHEDANSREGGRIASFKFDQFGFFTVTLTNGQVWAQNTSDSTKAQWHTSPEKIAYNVVISEALLGSYNLKVTGMPGTYKVKRLK